MEINADILVNAYAQGIFPMHDPDEDAVHWYSPDPRAIFPLDTFHIPRSLQRVIRTHPFEICADRDFKATMLACATPRASDPQTWINDTLVHAYVDLHHRGGAHSIEAWLDGQLVGGLYGVQLAGAFFGESMFVRPDLGGTNASKICLVMLVHWLRHRGFALLDTQFTNDHLEQFGCIEIPRYTYLTMLEAALDVAATWGVFRPLDDCAT